MATSLGYLTEYNKRMKEYHAANPGWTYLTTFEDLFDMSKVRNIFTFIDCEADFNESKITSVLADNLE